ncbi:MAG: SDR family oxidoreductase [Gammaproteobacteria bacterium]|nr:SDR family oxidoreductase [Gammaproteobacteria bacterium]
MNNNEKIIIIGGSSGIGLAAAKEAADQGYEVVIASRSSAKLTKALNHINHTNVSAETVNLLDPSSIKSFFKKISSFDHLVLAGSEVHFEGFKTLALKDAKQSFDSKFWGSYQAVHAALPYIKATGSITLFSGSAGQRPEEGSELISAINSAVESLGRALSISLAPIRVNTIAPGLVDTPVYAEMSDEARESLFDYFSNKLIIKRPAKAKEIARAVLYLIQSTYTTGTTLAIDGGHVLR